MTWVNKKLDKLNNIKGELDLLGTRLANVRTWNYISNQKEWINTKSELAIRARYIENRLSDALHEGLIERFVDYKMAKFSKNLEEVCISCVENGSMTKDLAIYYPSIFNDFRRIL